MKILDLRTAIHRVWRPVTASRRPWWQGTVNGLMDFIQDRRVSRRSAPPARPRIVSVGNLAVGGTGKTPVVIQLALDLAAAGHCGCVLTRGYGSGLAGPLQVDPADELAGDEARMMAALLQPTGWPVVQSRRRRDGVQWIRRHLDEVDLVLLEDGHQTPIGRHLDVLIVDTWHDDLGGLAVRTGPVMPFGPWRESARGARRADLLLLEAQAPPATSTTGQPVTGFVRRLVLDPAPVTGAPWAALSGVARPLRFEEDATAVLGRPPELAIRCDDHSGYGAALLNRITGALRAAGAPCTVTTRKDWTKLAPSWPEDLPVIVADQDLSWTGKQTLPAMVGERLDNR